VLACCFEAVGEEGGGGCKLCEGHCHLSTLSSSMKYTVALYAVYYVCPRVRGIYTCCPYWRTMNDWSIAEMMACQAIFHSIGSWRRLGRDPLEVVMRIWRNQMGT
jgi:hypothetical protein